MRNKTKGVTMFPKINIDTKKWKQKLNKAIDYSQKSNIPDSILEKMAKSIISFTVLTTSPDTESEKLFYDMWKNADKEEKNVLTKTLLRLIRA